ncbi:hypothetical protein C6N75_21800 [Streptomyces solincola]|uniref:Uncharacterized protein n=1 Tax=Streptomyces solincola TaxID=2100817 RepID=A0A2S9PRU7_9ACTN|nr:hypothetical protein [Streptomyces solincola]PRH77150.1 hypothetical protein C6N75_21800 [Streptomyces solincola]
MSFAKSPSPKRKTIPAVLGLLVAGAALLATPALAADHGADSDAAQVTASGREICASCIADDF